MEHYENYSLENIIYFCEIDQRWKTEEWRDIKDYEGLYRISDLGRIVSLRNKTIFLKQGHGKYLTVALSRDKSAKTFNVHALISIAFLNHTPCGHRLVVDHKNNNKKDNRACNLQLISHRENSSKDKKRISKYTGVIKRKDRPSWITCIAFKRKQIRIMSFKTEKEAGRCYEIALQNSFLFDGDENKFRKLVKDAVKADSVSD